MPKITKAEIDQNRREWIDALNSGYYRQGNGYLKRGKGYKIKYCCFGVLCEINTDKLEQVKLGEFFSFNGSGSEPPEFIVELVGLDTEQMKLLMRLNDDHEVPFHEIASVIESMEIRRQS